MFQPTSSKPSISVPYWAHEWAVRGHGGDIEAARQRFKKELEEAKQLPDDPEKVSDDEEDGLKVKALKRASARRSAAFAAATKRWRRAFAAVVVDQTAKDRRLDLTMTSAAVIFKTATGFKPSTEFLVERYGTSGRDASSKTVLLDWRTGRAMVPEQIGQAIKPHVDELVGEIRLRTQAGRDEKAAREELAANPPEPDG